MVKVTNPSDDRAALMERKSKLLEIAKSNFEGRVIVSTDWNRYILISSGPEAPTEISVDSSKNKIAVNSLDWFEAALNLAKAYEEVYGKNSFTLVY